MFWVEAGLILAVLAGWWCTSKIATTEEPAVRLSKDTTNPDPVLLRPPRGLVLFLDFDGVLHPGLTDTFCHRDNLEHLLRANPTVEVVISSDWRRADLTYLQELFSEDVRERIIGRTGYVDGLHARHKEIMAFCRTHNIVRWLAVDDDATLFPPGCPNLFLLDGRQGLTHEATGRLALQVTH